MTAIETLPPEVPEWMTGRPTIDCKTIGEAIRQVRTLNAETFTVQVPEPLRTVLRGTLIRDQPARRMPMAEIATLLSRAQGFRSTWLAEDRHPRVRAVQHVG
ncbi:MAG: hypothetical protein K8U03_25805 [Planctomycetia bacterium]|nr:hypothetical protein [Planctomycetia bacterium]